MCNLAVIIIEDKVIKACQCDAPVIAEMEGEAKGTGELKND
jgi:hypothetical protein